MNITELRMSTPLLQRPASQNRSICSTVFFAGSTLIGLAATGLTTYTLLDGEENGLLGVPEYLALGASVACTIASAIGFWKSRGVKPVDQSSEQVQVASQTSEKIWASLKRISGDLDEISRQMDSKMSSSGSVDIEMGIVSEEQIFTKVSELQSRLALLKTSAQSVKTQLDERGQLQQEVTQLTQRVRDYETAQQAQSGSDGIHALLNLNQKLQSAQYSDSDTDSVFSSPESAERKNGVRSSIGSLQPRALQFDSPPSVATASSANANT